MALWAPSVELQLSLHHSASCVCNTFWELVLEKLEVLISCLLGLACLLTQVAAISSGFQNFICCEFHHSCHSFKQFLFSFLFFSFFVCFVILLWFKLFTRGLVQSECVLLFVQDAGNNWGILLHCKKIHTHMWAHTSIHSDNFDFITTCNCGVEQTVRCVDLTASFFCHNNFTSCLSDHGTRNLWWQPSGCRVNQSTELMLHRSLNGDVVWQCDGYLGPQPDKKNNTTEFFTLKLQGIASHSLFDVRVAGDWSQLLFVHAGNILIHTASNNMIPAQLTIIKQLVHQCFSFFFLFFSCF